MKYTVLFIIMIFNLKVGFCQIKGSLCIPDPKFPRNYMTYSSETGHYSNYIKDTIKLRYEIDTLNGKFNGKLKIWDLNNKLLVFGKFRDNQKKGKWIFNPFLSRKSQVIRRYKNNCIFKQRKPYQPNKKLKYPTIKNDSLNYVIHPDVSDEDIYVSRRNWRFVPNNSNNKYLFEGNKLWHSLKNNINNGVNVYKDSYFTGINDKSELRKILADTDIKILGYKIVELFYCNKSYSICESRLMGICPVIKTGNKVKDLIWFYYPEIRSSLLKISFEGKNKISNMEEVFYKSYFNSFIYEVERLDGENPASMSVVNPKATARLEKFSIINVIYNLYLEWEFVLAQ